MWTYTGFGREFGSSRVHGNDAAEAAALQKSVARLAMDRHPELKH